MVLSNSGPLIALGKLNRLTVLSDLYGTIHIPRTVYGEVVATGIAEGRTDAYSVKFFLERYQCPILEASHEVLQAYRPPVVLDAGERELLALAHDLRDPLVLLDDEVARSEARRLSLHLKGTLGVLVQAHGAGLLPLRDAELLILEIAARPDIWISKKLCQAVVDDLRRRS